MESPKLERYSRYRGEPINIHSPLEHSNQNSRIYMKQGLMKRNDIGWDGVKLSEYVTAQIAGNY